MTTAPSSPAFSAICRTGACSARRTMLMPIFWSSFADLSASSVFRAHGAGGMGGMGDMDY